MSRRRIGSTGTLQERCEAQAAAKLEAASRLPPGPERDALEREARQLQIAFHLDDWLSSPGLQPPK